LASIRTSPVTVTTSVLVNHGDMRRHRLALAGEDPAVGDLVVIEGVVRPHPGLALGDLGDAGGAVARLTGEGRAEPGPPCALQQGLARMLRHGLPLPGKNDADRPLPLLARRSPRRSPRGGPRGGLRGRRLETLDEDL